jgi:hypothetical protein
LTRLLVLALRKMGPLLPYGTLIWRRLTMVSKFLDLKASAAAEPTAACRAFGDLAPYEPACYGLQRLRDRTNACNSAQNLRSNECELAAGVFSIIAIACMLYSQTSQRRIARCPTNFRINFTSYHLGSAP